jgi:hypothetical protein
MTTRRLLLYATILALIASNTACSPQINSIPAPGMGSSVIESTPVPATNRPTADSQSVPGIDTPLNVEDAHLQLLGAITRDTYCSEVTQDMYGKRADDPSYDHCPMTQEYYYTTNPSATLLIVLVSMGRNAPSDDVTGEVSVTDENGLQSRRAKTQPSELTDANGVVLIDKHVDWVFAVERASRLFTLHLPGGQDIKLDRLLYTSTNTPPLSTVSTLKERIVLTSDTSTISVPYCKKTRTNGSTYLCMSSDQGEQIGLGKDWIFSPSSIYFRAFMLDEGEVVVLQVGNPTGLNWHLQIAPPDGGSWGSNLHGDIDIGRADRPLLEIRGKDIACDLHTVKYKFEVLELAYRPGDPNTLERFAANFEYHCDGQEPALRGVIRINSTVAP